MVKGLSRVRDEGTDYALISAAVANVGLVVEGLVVGATFEERVHEDEGGAYHDEVDEGIQQQHDKEDHPLVAAAVADSRQRLLHWFVHPHALQLQKIRSEKTIKHKPIKILTLQTNIYHTSPFFFSSSLLYHCLLSSFTYTSMQCC